MQRGLLAITMMMGPVLWVNAELNPCEMKGQVQEGDLVPWGLIHLKVKDTAQWEPQILLEGQMPTKHPVVWEGLILWEDRVLWEVPILALWEVPILWQGLVPLELVVLWEELALWEDLVL